MYGLWGSKYSSKGGSELKVLLRFNKGPSLRWISHLDLIKVFEKALRRADLPVTLSQGFNPRPKMSIALPLPVGVSSEGEYMELELSESMEFQELCNRLNLQLPTELQILKGQELPEKSPAIMSQVETSEYMIHIQADSTLSEELERIIQVLISKTEILVQFQNKEGKIKIQDIKPGLRSCKWLKETSCIHLHIETSSRLFIRPQFVLQAITELMDRPQWSMEEIDIHRVKITLNPKIVLL
jgi:radical SAM-linked protein